MKAELAIFLIVALIAAIGFVQVETTGMQVFAQPTLTEYLQYFFTGSVFDAAIFRGTTRDPGELGAQNMIINNLVHYIQVPDLFNSKVFVEGEADYTATNAIVIGTPCHNKIVQELLEIKDCKAFFKPGEGMVKLIVRDNRIYVIVTGYSDREVFNAALLLTSHTRIYGTEIRTMTRTMQEAVYIPLDVGESIGGWGWKR